MDTLAARTFVGTAARPAVTAGRLALLAVLAALFVLLAGNFALYARYVIEAIGYPYQIDYGEGVVWWQMAALGRPGGMYTDVHAYPWMVYHYPPLYHLASYAAAAALGDALAAGRAVSAAATLALALLMAAVTAQAAGRETPPVPRAIGAGIAALLPFGFTPVYEWSPLMRVDMLAVMLNVAGIALFLASLRRPRLFYLAGLAFVAAAFTKQTMITGAAACFAVSLAVRPALTLRVLAMCVAVGLAGLAALTALTDGQFLLHILRYNANEYSLKLLADLLGGLLIEHRFAFAAMGAAVLFLAWPARGAPRPRSWRGWIAHLRGDPQAVATVTLIAYVAAGTVTALSLGKVGSYYNHAIDWMCAWSLVIGLAVAHLVRLSLAGPTSAARRRATAAGIAMALAIGWQVYDGGARWTTVPDDAERTAAARLVDELSRAPGAVWSIDMVATMRAGKDVIAEPAIVADLAKQGVWDEAPLLDRLRHGGIDLVVVEEWRPTMYTPAMRAAVEESFPVTEGIGEYTLYRRAAPP
ncbi:MAG: hypothetical protein AB7K86_14385 [Rhodospirillales bacterium]